MEAVKEVDETIECVTVSNGIQAQQWLRHTGHPVPDLIFLDINMPPLNGRNCLAKIKKDHHTGNYLYYFTGC
jgi:CheY-like chemotaxis protein